MDEDADEMRKSCEDIHDDEDNLSCFPPLLARQVVYGNHYQEDDEFERKSH